MYRYRAYLIGLFLSICTIGHGEENIDPQWFFSHLEKEASGMSAERLDSTKNRLMSLYIKEYRELGKEHALDSLAFRTDNIIKSCNAEFSSQANDSKGETGSVSSKKEKKNTKKSNEDAEIERLTKQKQQIEEKIEFLRQKKEPEEKNNRYTYTIVREIERTNSIADSLTKMDMQRQENPYFKPLTFDTISHSDFLPLFTTEGISYLPIRREESQPTRFQAQYQKAMIRKKIERRRIAQIATSQPELIEYYNLSAYDDKAYDIQGPRKDIYLVNIERQNREPAFDQLSKLMKKNSNGPWSSYKKLTIHFSQYYVNNWYKGGTPNSTLLSILVYNKNYNKNDILTWDNSLNMEVGFYNTSQDTIRAFRVNNDEFDILSRVGYFTGIKKLYYSFSGEFSTSLFTSYDGINSNDVATAFLSPSTLTFGLGADYRYNKKTFIQLSPFAYRLIFITDDRVNPVAEGIKDGKIASYWGYKIYGQLYWKFSREINFSSKANVFCSYPHDYIEMELELVGNFIINRFLSSRISFKIRSDNKETIETGIQEQLSLGFNYEF